MIESLYLLLPLSVLFAVGIGVAFWWAIFSGQFDDIQRAADAVLADDDNTQALSDIPTSETPDSIPEKVD